MSDIGVRGRFPATWSGRFVAPCFLLNYGQETARFNTITLAGRQVPDVEQVGAFGESRELFFVNWPTNWGGWKPNKGP
jgi:hypothetical protein